MRSQAHLKLRDLVEKEVDGGINNYILQGRDAEARKPFGRLLTRCNDVGLFFEEIDSLTR